MNSPSDEKSSRERRLDEVVTAYLKDVEAGQEPNQAEWLARYPDLAGDLGEFLAAQEQVDRLAAPLRQSQPLTANDAPTIGTSDAPASGTRVGYFGDYELLEEIGRGGMGVVFKARQASLKRVVALKMILRGQLANEDEVHRFHAEAESAAKLVHPGIVPVFEVGTYEGHHYFTMAFVDGESLAHRLTRGLLSPRDAGEMTRKIALAVAYAHTEGVIHRDLKPANILLDQQGEPHLTDFGLAKRVQAEPGSSAAGLTATGQILGTPSYMPPEQASGVRGAVGPVADVYSLGAILYCLMTGRPPFQADNPFDTLLQVVEQEPVSPRQLNAKVPRDLETICLKCLEKEPKNRYGSAPELTADLERYLAGRPIHARPIGFIGRAGRWCRRNPVVASLTATTAAALIAGSVISTLFGIESANRAKDAKDEAARADTEAGRAKSSAEREAKRAQTEAQAKEVAERLLYISQINLAHNEWRAANIDRASKLLDECDRRRRGWEWHYLARLERGAIGQLKGHESSISALASSPEGALVAGASIDGSVYVWDAASGKVVRRFRGHRDSPTCVNFSADGKRIASGSKSLFGWSNQPSSGEAIVWEPETGNVILTIGREHLGVTGVALSPDGERLATVGNDGKVRVWSVPNGEPIETVEVAGAQGLQFLGGDGVLIWGSSGTRRVEVSDPKSGWHFKGETLAHSCPKGNFIATAGAGDAVSLRDPADGKLIASLRGFPDGVRSLVFNRAGTRLAAGGAAGQAKLWDVSAREEIAVFRERQPWIDGLAFVNNDQNLAIAAGNPVFEILGSLFTGKEAPPPDPVNIRSALGQESASFRHERPAASVALTSGAEKSGIWLATERGMIQYDPLGTEAPRPKPINAGSVTSLAVSLDGKLLAVALTMKAEKGTAEGYAVKLVDAATGNDTRDLGWRSSPTTALAFSPDGATLAVTSNDERTTLWDVATAKCATLIGDSGGTARLEFSRDGKTLYRLTHGMVTVGNVAPTHFRSGVLEHWDTATHKRIRGTRPSTELCNHLALRRDGDELAVADGAGVMLLDPATGDVRRTIEVPGVRGLAYHPDNRRLALLDRHGVRLWDTEANQELLALRGTFDHIAFTHDGQFLAASHSRGVQFFDGRPTAADAPITEKRSGVKKEPPADSRPAPVIEAVRRAADALDQGDSAAAMPWLVEALKNDLDDIRKGLYQWRLGWALQDVPRLRPVIVDGKVTNHAFDKVADLPLTPDFSDPIDDPRLDPLLSPDGRRIAFTTRRREGKSVEWAIELCDADSGAVIATTSHPLPRYSGRMYAFSADGRRFASFEMPEGANKGAVIRVRETKSGSPIGPPIHLQLAEKDWDEISLSLSPDGRLVTLREGWAARTTRLFDAATAGPLVLPEPYNQAFFSDDGKWILTAETGRRVNQAASVWNAETRSLVSRIYVGGVHDASFSADGKRVLIAHNDYYLSAWDVASATRLHAPIVVPHGARALTFSPDGRRFAAAFERDKQQSRIWDTETGDALSPPMPLPGSSACRHIRFLLGGRVLFTATDDEARFWDAQTG